MVASQERMKVCPLEQLSMGEMDHLIACLSEGDWQKVKDSDRSYVCFYADRMVAIQAVKDGYSVLAKYWNENLKLRASVALRNESGLSACEPETDDSDVAKFRRHLFGTYGVKAHGLITKVDKWAETGLSVRALAQANTVRETLANFFEQSVETDEVERFLRMALFTRQRAMMDVDWLSQDTAVATTYPSEGSNEPLFEDEATEDTETKDRCFARGSITFTYGENFPLDMLDGYAREIFQNNRSAAIRSILSEFFYGSS